VASEPGRVCGVALASVQLDPVVDLNLVRLVVNDGGNDEVDRDLEVGSRLLLVAVVSRTTEMTSQTSRPEPTRLGDGQQGAPRT
jgi:hypothetical protein